VLQCWSDQNKETGFTISLMLNNKIVKKNNNKKHEKQPELTNETRDPSHEIEISS